MHGGKVAWQTTVFDLADKRGWTARDLARELGCAESTVSRVRRGKVRPSVEFMWACARVFQARPSDLFWEERKEEAAV